jgi:hypothetical protein
MRRSRFTNIGLDRLVRLAWLEKTASLVISGNEGNNLKKILQNDLKASFQSQRTDVRGSLDKTITILMKVWSAVPSELESLRADGIKFLTQLPAAEHAVIHWGMIMAVYPFWSGVAMQVGRLLRLQGTVVAAQIQRRVCEQYGERETVSRRARYVLRSYVDWGLLQETDSKGAYVAGKPINIDNIKVIAWVAEASLMARAGKSAAIKELIDSPGLFPFQIRPVSAESLAAASSRIDVLHHGLDDNLVRLK